MKNQQGVPEALRTITRYEVVDCIDSKHVPAVIPNKDGPWVRYEDHVAALVEAQQPVAHVQNPAEIEHVAGDVSKNGAESNMAQQPAPSEQQPFGWIKQSEIDSSKDFGGSINLWRQKYDCDVPVYLAQQPAPSAAVADLAFMLKTARLLAELHGETSLSEQQCAKHMGIDLVSWRRLEDCFSVGVFMPEGGGAELPREDSESVLREALGMQPSPTPQADSVTAPAGGAVAEVVMAIRPPKASPAWLPHKIIHASLQWLDSVPVGTKLYATPPAQAADSVLEDAARLEQIAEAIRDYHHALDMRKHGGLAESAAFSSICNTMGMHWNRGEEAARRAARKQGGA